VLHSWVQGLAIWPIVALISLFTLVLATSISHTIAAVLLIPIAAEIGAALDEPHPRLLIMVTFLV
jgi:phosphate transporter